MTKNIGLTFVLLVCIASNIFAADGWVQFDGKDGPGNRKNIVLISGDEEYRSEEVMPMLAKILSVHHGFDCTVVFSMSEDGKYIDPNNQKSLEGVEALKFADLMVIATRFRRPGPETMKYIDEYLAKGKPVTGLRTATHGFSGISGEYAHYSNGHGGPKWKDGFGRHVLGEKWISHHGAHGRQSTLGIPVKGQESHPILTGVKPKSIWGPSDVYGVRLPLPGDSQPIVLGAILEGMKPGDKAIDGPKNDPMMPVVWTKSYSSDSGNTGRAVCTTMGAATDFVEPGLRRVVVNSVYWALGMEDKISADGKIEFVGEYKPSGFGFRPEKRFPGFWKKKDLQPSDFAISE